jgi:hypothetical protein
MISKDKHSHKWALERIIRYSNGYVYVFKAGHEPSPPRPTHESDGYLTVWVCQRCGVMDFRYGEKA